MSVNKIAKSNSDITCVARFKDSSGAIIGYNLQNSFDQSTSMTAKVIRNSMKCGLVVKNLTLTSDDRIIITGDKSIVKDVVIAGIPTGTTKRNRLTSTTVADMLAGVNNTIIKAFESKLNGNVSSIEHSTTGTTICIDIPYVMKWGNNLVDYYDTFDDDELADKLGSKYGGEANVINNGVSFKDISSIVISEWIGILVNVGAHGVSVEVSGIDDAESYSGDTDTISVEKVSKFIDKYCSELKAALDEGKKCEEKLKKAVASIHKQLEDKYCAELRYGAHAEEVDYSLPGGGCFSYSIWDAIKGKVKVK